MGKNLIIVSNRLPFSIRRTENGFETTTSSGGLVSALLSLTGENHITWIGMADFSQDDWEAFKATDPTMEYKVVPIFLEKTMEDLYYNGFSNSLLWPLFHYFPTLAEYNEDSYKAYRAVNRIFADTVRREAGEKDLVWVHDYHLMLVPGFLHNHAKPVSSSFFLHIPFPSFELVKLVPEEWRNSILKSLLCAKVVGLHTTDYANHLKSSLSYFLGVENVNDFSTWNGNVCCIRAYPISVDFDKFNNAYDDPEVATLRNSFIRKQDGAGIIFSLDRLDYSKGVMNRLRAYEQLLVKRPDLHNKVVFIINVIPSRENIFQYAERKRMIEENISRINGLYGSIQWQPIIYQYQHLSFKQLMACYTGCDAALVTPLRDGMNLVAKEFVASRKDLKGTLILSEFAGAALELREAIMVNPNDDTRMQEAMVAALTMGEPEQEARMRKMQEVIRRNDIHKWLNSFLQDAQNEAIPVHLPENKMRYYDRLEIYDAYQNAAHRLILLDYDGTLVPFFNKPEEAVPGDMLRNLVNRLSADPRNKVMLISGRDSETLEAWFRGTNIDIAAEHGILHRPADTGSWNYPPSISLKWKDNIKQLLEKYTRNMPGSFLEEKNYAVALHYRASENVDEEALRMNFSRDITPVNIHGEFDILYGNKVIEIKSSLSNKGRFVTRFMRGKDYDFVLAIGDDTTDEEMFLALDQPNHYTIKVGAGRTAARYNLVGVNNVITFLEGLSQLAAEQVE